MRCYSFLVAVLVLAWGSLQASVVGGDDTIADVHKLEAEFHAACDKWEAAVVAGDDTAPVGEEIASAYLGLVVACNKAQLQGNNAVLLLDQVAWAGKLTLPSKREVSCMIGKGQTGLIVCVWHRTEWEEQLPPHGINGGFGVEPEELFDQFSVAAANWEDQQKTLMRVPYSIRDAKGFIEIHRDGEKWTMRPDRGTLDGKWWRPFPE